MSADNVTGFVERGQAIEPVPAGSVRGVAGVGLALLGGVLIAAASVRPIAAVVAIPLLLVLGAAVVDQPGAVRGLSSAVAAVASVALFAILFASTPAGVVAAVLVVPLAAAWPLLSMLARPALIATAVVACLATVVVTAVWPPVALVAVAVAVAVVVANEMRTRLAAAFPALRPAVIVPAGAAMVALAAAFAVWPATTALLLAVAGAAALSWRVPAAALALGLLLLGFEGSVKLLLALESSPLPGSSRAAGAAAIDLALFAAVAGTLIADRGRTGRLMWSRASAVERATAGALGGWLAASVVQIAQGGHLERGLQGFRLFQLYTLLAAAAAVACARPEVRRSASRVLLWIGLVVSAYAAVRVVVGPAAAERRAALSIDTVTGYGGAFRAVGSFSSAVGLASYLTPVTVFALVAAYLSPRLRRLALATAGLGLIGLLGSYSRASLVGVVLGLLCALALLVAAADVPRRRKLVSAGLVLATLAVTYGGIQVAAQASPQLRQRAKGILNPFDDASMKLRWRTWKRTARAIRRAPLGHGVGAAGSASKRAGRALVTTDNSFLKVLFEQGVVVAALFIGGMLAAIVVLARRLRRVRGEPRATGLAALAGFVAFLAVSLTGEYVEQPGKVMAWTLLGVAVAVAFGTDAEQGEPRAEGLA